MSHADPTPLLPSVLPFPGGCVLMDGAMMDTSQIKKPARKAKSAQVSLAYRLAVTSRTLAALFGGYLLAALTSVCLTQWLPMPRADAVVTGMLLSFLAYLGAVIWCFACRTAWRAWAGILLPAGILAALFCIGRWLS